MAEVYEMFGMREEAAGSYIQARSFAKAAPLMRHVTDIELHKKYAEVREKEGKISDAIVSYKVAGN